MKYWPNSWANTDIFWAHLQSELDPVLALSQTCVRRDKFKCYRNQCHARNLAVFCFTMDIRRTQSSTSANFQCNLFCHLYIDSKFCMFLKMVILKTLCVWKTTTKWTKTQCTCKLDSPHRCYLILNRTIKSKAF